MYLDESTKKFVRVLIRNNEGKYLVVSRRYGKKVLWNYPGGKVEYGEEPERAAIREVKEEVGLNIRSLKLIWKDMISIEGEQWFGYFYTAKAKTQFAENREKGRLLRISYKNIKELLHCRSIKVALVYVAAVAENFGAFKQDWPNKLKQIPLPLWQNTK
jgi:8-oxo-dGTP pyrophosphatase MutT (NUDIX family)